MFDSITPFFGGFSAFCKKTFLKKKNTKIKIPQFGIFFWHSYCLTIVNNFMGDNHLNTDYWHYFTN